MALLGSGVSLGMLRGMAARIGGLLGRGEAPPGGRHFLWEQKGAVWGGGRKEQPDSE